MNAYILKNHVESKKTHQALYPVSSVVQKNPYKYNWNLRNGEKNRK